MNRGYQHGFSALYGDSIYNSQAKQRKANTMVKVLGEWFGHDRLRELSILDVGASTGFIDDYLAQFFGKVHGIDIDDSAIGYACKTFKRKNLKFATGDAMAIDSADEVYDVVICSQVYEHVPDARKMMKEIYRVLRPGGVCYFAATNRLSIEEHHHHLPFLSILPRPLGHLYLRLAGKGNFYYEKHLSFWGLKAIVSDFERVDYSRKLIDSPERYEVAYMLPPDSRKHILAKFIIRWMYWLSPGYIWLLRKPGVKTREE
jgi:ubiquinone/menaquinone biosynthesis C-methylase UbiE